MLSLQCRASRVSRAHRPSLVEVIVNAEVEWTLRATLSEVFERPVQWRLQHQRDVVVVLRLLVALPAAAALSSLRDAVLRGWLLLAKVLTKVLGLLTKILSEILSLLIVFMSLLRVVLLLLTVILLPKILSLLSALTKAVLSKLWSSVLLGGSMMLFILRLLELLLDVMLQLVLVVVVLLVPSVLFVYLRTWLLRELVVTVLSKLTFLPKVSTLAKLTIMCKMGSLGELTIMGELAVLIKLTILAKLTSCLT